jgi:protein-disulfide isomerase
MGTMKRNLTAFLLLLTFVLFPGLAAVTRAAGPNNNKEVGPTPAPAATGNVPAKGDVDTALKRTFGYDPSITWMIYDIRATAIPGLADVLVSLNRQQPQHIYISAETQTAIIGELIPFGPNPFAPIRATLQAANGPAQGSQTPTILLVEFSDLECPHCKAAQPIVEKLVGDFPQVRYVFEQFPLPATMHPWAMKAAQYADCVQRLAPASFFKYINAVFENQGGIAAATADDKLKEFAKDLGLDPEKVAACSSEPQTEASIKKSLDLGESLNVNQTPTLFINGRRVLGLEDIPYSHLKTLVQFEIDHAGK